MVASLGLCSARAVEADHLARIHVEAIGGMERLRALTSLRVTGVVYIDGRRLQFTMLAQRSNRVRIETRLGEHVLVQATDGKNPPWQVKPAAGSPAPSVLTGFEAREFAADAEFDDPLVDYAAKGYALDYAGETTWDGRKSFKLLVTRRLVDSYYLVVDAETYFITGKLATRQLEDGTTAQIVTRYEDFRPVAGVIMPFRIVVQAEGKPLHETDLQTMDANVPVPPGSFTMPVVKFTD
ncbi:MAG: hypothetical protein ACHQ4G_07915 [Opitutales bacterium]